MLNKKGILQGSNMGADGTTTQLLLHSTKDWRWMSYNNTGKLEHSTRMTPSRATIELCTTLHLCPCGDKETGAPKNACKCMFWTLEKAVLKIWMHMRPNVPRPWTRQRIWPCQLGTSEHTSHQAYEDCGLWILDTHGPYTIVCLFHLICIYQQ